MLHVMQSNRIEDLATMMAHLLGTQKTSPFHEHQIMVQSPGMGTWLKIQLAEQHGISAGIQYPLPSSFIWKLFHWVLPQAPEENNFTKDAMTWKLIQILPDLLHLPLYQSLQDYLQQGQPYDLRLYQLCRKIADVYDHYLMFRPEWILAWEADLPHPDPHIEAVMQQQAWQASLWRALVAYNKETLQLNHYHRANLHEAFIEGLKKQQDLRSFLGEQIYIFGISSMSVQTLEIVHELSKHMDVFICLMNPCQHYWGDLIEPKHRAKALKLFNSEKGLPEDWQEQLVVGNALLAHNGKLGREFMDLLLQLPTEDITMDIEAFAPHKPKDGESLCLLHQIQNDILELEMRGTQNPNDAQFYQSNQGKTKLDAQDRSLSFWSCHSLMREIEVLHDQLLQTLAENPQLKLKDIVVMMPNVAEYAPYIDAVFGKKQAQHKLRYAISDRGALEENPTLQSFMDLLKVHEIRMGYSEVMRFLEVPAIQKKFNLNDTELSTVRLWLIEAGVRWGRDQQHRAEQNMPAFHQHSWAFGIRRILLGFAMPNDSNLFADHLPLEGVEGQSTQCLGGLLDFLEALEHFRVAWQKPHKPQHKITQLRAALDQFYLFETESDQEAYQLLLDCIERLEQQWHNANIGQPQHSRIISQFFEEHLGANKVGQRFLAGAINFCTLMPMRAIPFKVICLLGMNAKDYPRSVQKTSFDLIAQTPSHRGDRNRRHEDRYLFLEALLSAREKLYISYVGKDVRDNHACLPSLLVTELLDYAQLTQITAASFDLPAPTTPTEAYAQADLACQQVKQALLTQCPLQPFDAKHYEPGRLQSYNPQWLPSHGTHSEVFLNLSDQFEVAAEPQVEINSLLQFLRDPSAFFFQRTLKIFWNTDTSSYRDDEPFELNTLELYQLKQVLINAGLQATRSATEQHLKAQGHLPHAPFDDLLLQEQSQQVLPLIETLSEYALHQVTFDRIQLQLEQVRLVGEIGNISHAGLILYHASSAKISHKLRLACLHLIRQAQGLHQPSYFFDPKTQYHLEPMPQAAALKLLNLCVHYYFEGQKHPLQWDQSLDDYHQAQGSHQEKMQTLYESSRPSLFSNPYHERLTSSPEYLDLDATQAIYVDLLEPMLSMIQTSNLKDRQP
jgi:exodeoxyribonuclease V gamma subunit